MYLTKRKNFYRPTYADLQFEPDKGNFYIQKSESVRIENPESIVVDYELIYWRKANMIHQWFVDHIQEGEDDCGEYSVSLEELEELLNICNKVLENSELANELLPTKKGFFFGDTDYGENYFEDIKYTVDKLKEAIADFKSELDALDKYTVPVEIDMIYSSSW